MNDIPLFTSEFGIASLTLGEIPYTKKAYIRIQVSCEPEIFLQECGDFCRYAGAEDIYATGSPACEQYPHYTDILQMRGNVSSLDQTDACLFPVTENTLERFRTIYNEKVLRVPNGAWMSLSAGEKLLKAGNGYFVHKDGNLIGIGIASGNALLWVASVIPGGGKIVVQTLCRGLMEDFVTLEVASTNEKAVRLYGELGFLPVGLVSRWYHILSSKNT